MPAAPLRALVVLTGGVVGRPDAADLASSAAACRSASARRAAQLRWCTASFKGSTVRWQVLHFTQAGAGCGGESGWCAPCAASLPPPLCLARACCVPPVSAA
jgi:hypothetical protein